MHENGIGKLKVRLFTIATLAQLVEQQTSNLQVIVSNTIGGSICIYSQIGKATRNANLRKVCESHVKVQVLLDTHSFKTLL